MAKVVKGCKVIAVKSVMSSLNTKSKTIGILHGPVLSSTIMGINSEEKERLHNPTSTARINRGIILSYFNDFSLHLPSQC